MPKFYRQNKKKIDPRYFLNETTNRDEDLEEISSYSDGEMDAVRGIKPGKDMMSDKSYASGYNSQAGTDQTDQVIDNIESLLQSMLSSGAAYGMEVKFADVLDASMDKSLNDEQKGILTYAYLDSDPARRGKPKANRKELHRAMKSAVETVYSGLPIGGKTDSDNDGIPDEIELAVIDKGEI